MTYNLTANKITSKNFTFYKEKLPVSYLLYNKDRVFFDGKYAYILENGSPSWNSTLEYIEYKRYYPDVLYQ
jgi:hypothetical protein